jgi:pimeloyl-ACP methyl ester carboxylesterase
MSHQQPEPDSGAAPADGESAPLALHFHEFGQKDAPGGPVLILHGLFGSARNWQSVGQRLAARRRVLTVDLRNHGDSPHSDVHDYPAMAGDILALIRSLDLRDVTLVGHSMGGKTAMWLALQQPELVARLVIVDIAPVTYPDHFGPLIDALLRLPIETISSRNEADRQLAPAIPEAGLRQFLLQNLVRTGRGFRWRANLVALRANRHHVIGFPAPRPGARFPGPALFIRGDCSDAVTEAYVPTLQRYFPAATLAIIDGTGHWPHAEKPQAFYQVLADFVLKSGRAGPS